MDRQKRTQSRDFIVSSNLILTDLSVMSVKNDFGRSASRRISNSIFTSKLENQV